MLDRIVALLAFSLAVVVGSLFVAAQYSAAEPPPPVERAGRPGGRAGAASCAAADRAACRRGCAAATPAVPAAAEQAPAPVVTAPPAQEPAPAPVVSAPPAETSPLHVATAPAEPAPAPVVNAPLPPEKPALSMKDKIKGVAAKFLFAAEKLPTIGKAMAIGYYPRGCLQGGVELPVNGPTWQVMRLSRNRNWGHPELVRFLEKIRAARRQGDRLERHPGRRHGAAARRPAAVRPHSATRSASTSTSGSCRCRTTC